MFVLQVVCKCGFRSEEAVWGPPSLFDQDRIGTPVYLPPSGKLLTHWFDSRALGIVPEDLDSWFSANGREAVLEQYGKAAVIVSPPETDDQTSLPCPKCRSSNARVEVVGIH